MVRHTTTAALRRPCSRARALCNNRPSPNMLCGHCGATTSAEQDRCLVCNTPTPNAAANTPTMAGVVGGMPVLTAGHQFGRRYRIIRFLGSGGMAAVYQAWDETLGTAVALKLIRVDAGTPTLELRQLEDRFKRELKLARQVTHANVIRIHDLGEVESTLYFTMEYVQGSDLATLLEREPELSLSRALGLARQIASGLAAAHRAGVVHRDLKPANVMVDARGSRAADGLRHRTLDLGGHATDGAGRARRHARLHVTGAGPGRAGGRADGRLRLRSDPLRAARREAVPATAPEGGLSSLLARLEKGPPPIKTVLPEVPPAVERIVNKCLSSSPDARYPTANELLADLEALDEKGQRLLPAQTRPAWARIAAVLVARSVLIGGTWWLASRRPPPAPQAARAPLPILIVDFENRTGEDVFDGALEQALSTAMEGAPFITAFPRQDAVGLVQDLKLGSRLDESTGRLLAISQGIPGHPRRDDRAQRLRLQGRGPGGHRRQARAGDRRRGPGVRQDPGPSRGREGSGERPRGPGRLDRNRRWIGRDVHGDVARSRPGLHARPRISR